MHDQHCTASNIINNIYDASHAQLTSYLPCYVVLLVLVLVGAVRAWCALIAGGADPNIPDMRSRSALETAKAQGWTECPEGGLEYLQTHSVSTRSSEKRTKKSVTAVLTHPMCVRHFTCPPSSTTSPSAPPENIRRLTVLLDEVMDK